VNPFTALDRDWNAVATGPPARRAMRAWAERTPSLVGYDSPAELVADIGRMGDPERSCRLLAHPLVLAGEDTLAARAVLQSVIPGLRRAAGRRWRTASGSGPWPSCDDIAADTISAAWEAIHARAGERHGRPARIIVRFTEGRLRRAHESWRATNRDLTELTDETGLSSPAIDAALGTEQQALATITNALQAGIIDSKEASILIATAVHGRSVTEAEHALEWAPKSGYRVLDRARRALPLCQADVRPAGL
jgi:DNA-directed RNA polymerase specialized sigma24 family protein